MDAIADDVAITAGAGTTIATDQIGSGHHYQRVKITDGTADSENHLTVDSSGRAKVDPSGVTAPITAVPAATGGLSYSSGSIGATATSVKASAGQVYGWHFYNPNSTVAYVQFFNTASGSVALGTTAPVYSLAIPSLGGATVMTGVGVAHSTAITIGVTTTRTGSTGPTSTVDYNIFYA